MDVERGHRMSRAQRRVMDAIRKLFAHNGYAPTIREIAHALGLKSTKAVYVHLQNLEALGYIKRNGKARVIEMASDYMDIPVMGVISAGKPVNAQEYMEDVFHIPREEGAGRFFLRINGESMSGAGLMPGDLVLVDKSGDVRNNDIVVAMLNGEATIKRFVKRGLDIVLQPENPDYSAVHVNTSEDDFDIIGKVVGHLKLF